MDRLSGRFDRKEIGPQVPVRPLDRTGLNDRCRADPFDLIGPPGRQRRLIRHNHRGPLIRIRDPTGGGMSVGADLGPGVRSRQQITLKRHGDPRIRLDR